MDYYEVLKEDAILGPFNIDEIAEFVQSGLILKRDYAYNTQYPDSFRSVGFFLKQHGRNVNIEHRGGFFSQINDIGRELILPSKIFTKEPWQTDKNLLVLSLVGLGLSVIMAVAPFMKIWGIFYFVSLYFSIMWGLFFYYIFRTEQVKLSLTIILFFATHIIIILAYSVVGIGEINPFYGLYGNGWNVISVIACILGIGVVEESLKVLPIVLILYFSKYVIKPQTAVYYGLISGVSFGVFEGVQYQMGVNFQMLIENGLEIGYVSSYLANIARLTSLPFLHAVWCGIASYFMGFAYLYPRYRRSLYALAIIIPATIHGTYDFICFNVSFSLTLIPIVFVGVILLMVYLSIGYDFHSKLAD